MTTQAHDATDSATEHLDAVVVGAGFSGLLMVHRLRDELGLSVRGYETAPDVGGTWYWNRYPGARTDSLYSIYGFSFSSELVQEWTWSERYPGQQEVLRYLNFVADKLDLRPSFRFDSRIVSAHYEEDGNRWRVTTDSGETVTATFLVTGIGLLSAPNRPPFGDVEAFRGKLVHSANWPEHVDLAGKRVALVGTGSTGIQLLPKLAEAAEHVTVFQRTPNFVVPARNRPLTAEEQADLKARHREIAETIRQHPFAMPFTSSGKSALEVDEQERQAIYEEAWEKGGFYFLFETFDDLQLDVKANETACEFIRGKIRETVTDPETAEKLSPRGYPYGSKRPPAGTGYYEAYNRDDVDLVDVGGDPIQSFTPNGLRTASQEYEADVIVLATGFDASSGSFVRIDIQGRDGATLTNKWKDGPITNMGYSTAGFPNLLMITGPLSPFANIPTCIEETADWIVEAIKTVRDRDLQTIEATDEAEQAWFAHVQEIGNMIVAGHGKAVNTWFAGANIEGKAQVFNVYFGGANAFFDAGRAAAEKDYEGFALR